MKAEENRQGTRKWQIGIALSCILCCAFAIRTNETELLSLIACSVDFSMTVFFVFSPTLPAVSHFLRQFNEDDFRFHQRMSAKYFKFIHCNFYSGIPRCFSFMSASTREVQLAQQKFPHSTPTKRIVILIFRILKIFFFSFALLCFSVRFIMFCSLRFCLIDVC